MGISLVCLKTHLNAPYLCFKPHLHMLKNHRGMSNFWHSASFTGAETTSRGSLDTPKILSTGATLHLGPIPLHVEN